MFFCLIFIFYFFLSQAYSDEDRDSNPIKLLCKSTGHFEYLYKDKYFYTSYEWARKEKIVYFFHQYFINPVLYLCDVIQWGMKQLFSLFAVFWGVDL